jgi:hypothetical protein
MTMVIPCLFGLLLPPLVILGLIAAGFLCSAAAFGRFILEGENEKKEHTR